MYDDNILNSEEDTDLNPMAIDDIDDEEEFLDDDVLGSIDEEEEEAY